jgi:hypothetical protein
MNLPDDLRQFLETKQELQYSWGECEVGQIKLLELHELEIQLFPTDVDNGPFDHSADPHHREMGCYLVPAVSLVAECENYEPQGILLWIPGDRCFGTWDDSHTLIEAFDPSVTWTQIVAAPLSYIEAFWGGGQGRIGGLAPLVPWPRYEYSSEQIHWPIPLAGESEG